MAAPFRPQDNLRRIQLHHFQGHDRKLLFSGGITAPYTPPPFYFEDSQMASPHLEHHIILLRHLRGILMALGEAEQILDDSHASFLERYDELLDELPVDPEHGQYQGQELLSQIFQRYPQIAHLIPRDLLWFFGGDCLHFMPDEEIDCYQQLDERRFHAEKNGQSFDWNQEKQRFTLPQ
jgi:hypothetical protein